MKALLLPKHSGRLCTGLIFSCFLLCTSCTRKEAEPLNLIPKPVELHQDRGYFNHPLDFPLKDNDYVDIEVNPALSENKEAYELQVSGSKVLVKASSEAGVFYAAQTLQQIKTEDGYPCVTIKDYPRFQYRGIMIDVSRHFFDKSEIMKIMDVMSSYKLNRLHLHLTDAGGWRFVVDKYPKLTSETAFRTESDWRIWWNGKDRKYVPEGTEGAYGGYFTKQDLRDIVAYAADRNITVLPEIEFPGHSDEVFAAYPELNCAGKAYEGGDFCIGNP